MKFKGRSKLPDHPGELIRLAVLDLVAAASDSHFRLNMAEWFRPRTRKCDVCFAGAIIAQSLEAPIRQELIPADFPRKTANKLRALNEFRQGLVGPAYSLLERDCPLGLPYRVRVDECYNLENSNFIVDMLDLAAMIDDAEAANGN